MSSLPNPWRVIDPCGPTYVQPDDEPYVRAFNTIVGDDSPHALDLSLLPDPWVGRLDAPIVLLNLNPGRDPGDPAAHRLAEARNAIMANLRQEPTRFPLFYLDPDPPIADIPGARWWRRALRPLTDRFGVDRVASQVVCLEFHGYHSVAYRHLPVTLPSQWFVFDTLREAIHRDVTVVLLRGQAEWRVAVPELLAHRRVSTTRNPRVSAVSPRNCPEGWEQVVAVIKATSDN